MYNPRGSGVPPAANGRQTAPPFPQGLEPNIMYYNQPFRSGHHSGSMSQQHHRQPQQQQLYGQQQNYYANQQQQHQQHQQQLREQERQKRKELAQAKKLEQSTFREDLFEAPKKIHDSGSATAEKVLGTHKNFAMIQGSNSCIGVDFQPATPAPVVHNEDDEEEQRPARKAPMVKPPQNNTRLPANMENPRPPPTTKSRPPPPPSAGNKETWNAMAPPSTTNLHRMGIAGRVPPNAASSRLLPPPGQAGHPSAPPPPPTNHRLGRSAVAGNPSSSLKPDGTKKRPHIELGDAKLNQIFQEMKGPDLPQTPLSGIITPRVENTEDRGIQQHKPRYQTGMTTSHFQFPSLPMKPRLSESDSDKEAPSATKSGVKEESSSSGSEESSESDSEGEKVPKPADNTEKEEEESDEEPQPNKNFNLEAFIKKEEKTPPTISSVHSTSPRQYQPTPSPLPSFTSPGFIAVPELIGPIQSPIAAAIQSPMPATLVGQTDPPLSPIDKGDREIERHIGYLKDIPAAIPPLGPDSESDDDIQAKRKSTSSFEEDRKATTTMMTPMIADGRRKPPRKRKRGGDAAAANEHKVPLSKAIVDSDSDSDIQRTSKKSTGAHPRATSSSPMKVYSPKKSTSAQSTPARRSAASRPSTKSPLSSESDEGSSPIQSSQNEGNHKKQALLAMFGKKAGIGKGGGKGKNGGKGKSGGINFIVGERDEEEDWERDREGSSPVPAQPAESAAAASAAQPSVVGRLGKPTSSPRVQPTPSPRTNRQQHHHASPRIKTESKEESPAGPTRVPKLGPVVDQDLALSDDDERSPTIAAASSHARPETVVAWKPNGRPSLLCSVRLSRVSRHFKAESRPGTGGRGQSSKSSAKEKSGRRGSKDRWITKCDSNNSESSSMKLMTASKTSENSSKKLMNKSSSLSERTADDPPPRPELPERPASARSASRDRHGSGAASASSRSSLHRKQQAGERTISPAAVAATAAAGDSDQPLSASGSSSSDYHERKRRDRDSSPAGPPTTSAGAGAAKRPRTEADEDPSSSSSSSSMPPAHPTFLPGNGGCLMPPPRSYNSYFDRRMNDELEEEENVMEEGKRLKHEADQEENMEAKCTKYLQSFMMFIISAYKTEREGDPQSAFNMYDQTLRLIKWSLKPIIPRKQAWPPKEKTDIRLLVMSLRAQSLLNLKLYRLRNHEFKNNLKTINEMLSKADKDEDTSQSEQPQMSISPTPSPAGSEGSHCSKSSGYTSSGEGRGGMNGLPPLTSSVRLDVPMLQNHVNISSNLSQCHELWEQADVFESRGNCIGFFNKLDQECGTLTLHSSVCHLVIYTRKGLEYISQEFSSRPDHPNPSISQNS